MWKKKKTRVKITLFSLLIIICILQVVEIHVQNNLAIKDYEYAYLLTQLKKQIKENSILYEEILTTKSLTTISRKANERGFESAKYIFL